LDQTLERALDLEAKLFGGLCGSDEMREGTSAFLEKREPRFR
jgi:enoyl-CoA hydratase